MSLSFLAVKLLQEVYDRCFQRLLIKTKGTAHVFRTLMIEKQSPMSYWVVKKQASNKDFCFCRWKLQLMQLQVKMRQNSTNNLFRSKKTRNKVPLNIVGALEVRTKVRLMFRKAKANIKGKWNVFSGSKQTIRCAWCI